MSNLPRVITQVVLTGSKIFGRAMYEAGRQAYKNTQYRPENSQAGGDEGGATADGSGSPSTTAGITRSLRMTLQEAQLILNVKEGETPEKLRERYDILFEANSPPKVDPDAPPPPPLTAKQKRQQPPMYSHYLQSKVVRALERLESEHKMWAELDQAANGKPTEAATSEQVGGEAVPLSGEPPKASEPEVKAEADKKASP